METRKSQEHQNYQQQQNGGLVQDEAVLAKNLARDYMPPANWLELREAEKAFYERLAKGGATKVLIGTADVDLWLTQYRTTLIVQIRLCPIQKFTLLNMQRSAPKPPPSPRRRRTPTLISSPQTTMMLRPRFADLQELHVLKRNFILN